MNLFRKQLQHRPVFTALLALLLAAAMVVSSIMRKFVLATGRNLLQAAA